ncbi:MAG: HAD-IA family hydrolase [Cyanobacteria bacterium J06641_5]
MEKLQAIIFDMDGTIAETERDGHRVAFNRAFAAAGLDWHWSPELYGELLHVSGGKERMRHFCEHYQPATVLAGDPQEAIFRLHAAKNQHFRQILQSDAMPARPGILRLLKAARMAGIPLAVATTSALDSAIALLETALIPLGTDWFAAIAAGDIVPIKKPAPDIYQYVLRELALDPSCCIAIEDTDNGLQAATRAGIPTVITTNAYTQHQDFTGAALVIDSLGEPDEQPFRVLQGDALGKTYFDLELARSLL